MTARAKVTNFSFFVMKLLSIITQVEVLAESTDYHKIVNVKSRDTENQ